MLSHEFEAMDRDAAGRGAAGDGGSGSGGAELLRHRGSDQSDRDGLSGGQRQQIRHCAPDDLLDRQVRFGHAYGHLYAAEEVPLIRALGMVLFQRVSLLRQVGDAHPRRHPLPFRYIQHQEVRPVRVGGAQSRFARVPRLHSPACGGREVDRVQLPRGHEGQNLLQRQARQRAAQPPLEEDLLSIESDLRRVHRNQRRAGKGQLRRQGSPAAEPPD